MTVYTKDELPQGSEAWEKARAIRPTASNFKRIFTPGGKVSASAREYAIELVLNALPGFVDPFPFTGNKHTDWGNKHEAEARALFQKDHPHLRVDEVGFCVGADNFVGASPDGLLTDHSGYWSGGLELKCPAPQTHAEYLLGGVLPAEYKPQVHGALIVTRLHFWCFMSYFPGLRPFYCTVYPDDYTEKLREGLNEFRILYTKVRNELLGTLKEGAR